MKYILGVVSLIIGIFSNFLIFTQLGDKFIQDYSINILYVIILSAIALIVAIINLVKSKEKVFNILGIISNVIFLGYSIMLIGFVL